MKKHIHSAMLARYMEGLAAAEEKEQVERHLADCDVCREELVLAGRVFRERLPHIPIPESEAKPCMEKLGENVRRFISGWVSGLRPPVWILQIRNSASAFPAVSFRADFMGMSAEIYVGKTGEKQGRVCIKVSGEQLGTSDVHLMVRKEGGGTSARILKHGDAYFDKILPFGIYHIILRQSQSEYARVFEISEAGIYER